MISIPWDHKPPLGVPIDWSNPVTRKLVADVPCNEYAGYPYDKVTGLPTLEKEAGLIWKADGISKATEAVTGSRMLTKNYTIGTGDFTYLLLSKAGAKGAGNGYSLINNVGYYGGASTNYAMFGTHKTAIMSTANNTAGFLISVNSTTASSYSCTAPEVQDNKLHCWCAIRRNSTPEIWVDGRKLETLAQTGAWNQSIDHSGGNGLSYGVSSIATQYLFRIWSRALLPEEMLAITANPWQIYQPQLIPFLVQSASTIAMWCKVAGSLKAAEALWIKTGGNLKLVEAINAKVGGAIK